MKYIESVLEDYLSQLGSADSIVLGCTHYGLIKDLVRARVHVPVHTADEIVPRKLANYLERHPEIESLLGKRGERRFHVTDVTPYYEAFGTKLMDSEIKFERVSL